MAERNKSFGQALAALFAALIAAAGLCIAGCAEAPRSVLFDYDDVLTDDEEAELDPLLDETANEIGCNVGFVFKENLGMSSRAFAESVMDTSFGVDSSSIVVLVNSEEDWVSVEGTAEELYGSHSDKILSALYDGLNAGGFAEAVRSCCNYLRYGTSGAASASSGGFRAALSDGEGVLSASEESALLSRMSETAGKIQCNLGVAITDSLGYKSAESYANDYLDDTFGFGSSSVVFLFNNDLSDDNDSWISTCGRGTDVYRNKTDRIFDAVWNSYDASSSNGYYDGIISLCDYLERHSSGKVFDSPEEAFSGISSLASALFVPMFIALISTIMLMIAFTSGYKKKKPVSAAVYLDNDRTKFLRREDMFIREYTTSHRVSSSSSGGGGRHGGGGGHHSSSHHSHGGGGHRR